MITLITGVPGSGKSAALVDLLTGLSTDRTLYCNGIPDLRIAHIDWSDSQVRQWDTLADDGSAVVIDEVQRLWPPNRAGKPSDIAALEVHRHKGLDFFIVTQHPKLLHQNVRALVGRHVHLRDVGLLGRWWYEWPECSESIAWKSAPLSKRYKLPKKAFALYKSASLHIKPIRSFPRALLLLAVCLPVGGYLAWRVTDRIKSVAVPTIAAAPAASAPASAPGAAPPVVARHETQSGGSVSQASIQWPVYDSSRSVADREPYAARALQLDGGYSVRGIVVRYFGLLVGGQRVATVSLDQLVRMGYSWTEHGPCSGVLTFREKERPVTCGAITSPTENRRSEQGADKVEL